jgi:putative Holliday junction resolvase
VGVIAAEPAQGALERVAEYVRQYEAQGLVVGYPLNMDGSAGPQAKHASAMAAALAKATGLDVRLGDERLTSFAADAALAGHLTRKKRKARQDALAAAKMLQDFFDAGGPDRAPRWDQVGDAADIQ